MHHTLSQPQASLSTTEREQDVLVRLRRHTHAAHVRINHHPFVSGLTRQGYSLQRYQALLVAYYQLYAAIERHVETTLAAITTSFDYEQRKKLPWLTADLAWFGLDAHLPPWRPSKEPKITMPPRPGTLIGTLYVIEGATQGGKVISRHLRTSMNIDSDTGARFFTGYGDAEQTAGIEQVNQAITEIDSVTQQNAALVEKAAAAAQALRDQAGDLEEVISVFKLAEQHNFPAIRNNSQ